MHIQERNNTTLTTCTKMTEEVDRRHGMNGNSSSKGVSDENSIPSSAAAGGARDPSAGGRLKFFKDGKFILELARAREGERVGWVSVPRKTFWPPTPSGPPPAPTTPSTPSTTSARQERATSLSVSDDNSSVQSSPWQRDHCWKQATPRRGASRGMCMLYIRPSGLPARLLRSAPARLKRRRPLDPAPVLPHLTNGTSSPARSPDRDNHYRNSDKPTALGKFKFLRNKCESASEPVLLRVYKKSKKNIKRRELCKIIDTLKERLINFTPVNAKLTNCKQEHSMVSPRKRILRELERVTLEDLANKRSRARHPPSAPQPGPSCAPDTSSKLYNGSSNSRPHPPPSKPVSSYSINSLLSISEDNAPSRSPDSHSIKKPQAYSSVKNESPVSVHSPDSHLVKRSQSYAKTESPVSAHSPDSLSLKKSHYGYVKTESPVSVHSPDPSPSPEHYRRPAPAPLRPPYLPTLPYAPTNPPDMVAEYYYQEGYRGAGEELPYRLYPAPYLVPSPYMGAYSGYRTPAVWPQYPTLPPGAWPPMPHPLLTDHTSREDTSSDLPLNLSKH